MFPNGCRFVVSLSAKARLQMHGMVRGFVRRLHLRYESRVERRNDHDDEAAQSAEFLLAYFAQGSTMMHECARSDSDHNAIDLEGR